MELVPAGPGATRGGMLSDSIHADRIVAAVRTVRTAIATHTHVEMPPR